MDKKLTNIEIEKMEDEYMEKFGDYPIPEFEGLSANQMTNLLEDFLEEKSPISLYKDIDCEALDTIPLLQLMKYYLNLIIREGGNIKLTAAGYIPPKLVKEIYDTGFILDPMVENGSITINKELDSMVVELVKLLAHICRLTFEDKGKIQITELGEELLKNEISLLHCIIKGYSKEFNWAYFDACGDFENFQRDIGYTVYLLKKYGRKKLPISLYTDKFIKAFPASYEEFLPFSEDENDIEKSLDFEYTYYLRSFERFLGYFNLIDIFLKDENTIIISKTDIFDKIIKFSK